MPYSLSNLNSGMPISLVLVGGVKTGVVKFIVTPAIEILCNSRTYVEAVHMEYFNDIIFFKFISYVQSEYQDSFKFAY